MSNSTLRARLAIDIEYTLGGRNVEEARSIIRNLLEQAANHIAGEGLLTGDTEFEVERWEATVLRSTDNCIPVESGSMQNWDRHDPDGHPARDVSWRLNIDRLDDRGAVCVTVNSGPEKDPLPGLGVMVEINQGRPRMLVSLGDGSDNLLDVRSVDLGSGKAKLATYPDGNAVLVEACADADGAVGRAYSHKPG